MDHHLSRKRALSLVETVVAMFMLAAQILLVSAMVAQFNRTQRFSRLRTAAVALAQEKMDEIRAWARHPDHFRSDWSRYRGVAVSAGDFSIETDCNPSGQPLYSPCSGLEAQYGARAKVMQRSVIPVRVRVAWEPANPASAVELNSLVGEPPLPGPYMLTLEQSPGFTQPVLANQEFGYRVRVSDASGRPLNDLQFQWRVLPLTGNATLLPSPTRSMTEARARHVFVRYGVQVQISGDVQLECRTQYHGAWLRQHTDTVVLQ